MLLFHGSDNSAMRVPVDLTLFQLATTFAREQLANPLDLASVANVFLVWRTEIEDGKEVPVEVLSMGGVQSIVDVFLFRTKQSKFAGQATRKLWNRINNFLSDRGFQNQSVLLHFDANSGKETQCPQANEWLLAAKAEPANRLLVRIR